MKHIKDFENWRAEQMAKVFLSRFNNLLIQESYSSDLNLVIGVDYEEEIIEKLFGIEIKAGKNRSWFTNKISKNKELYEQFAFPVLLFIFDMDTDNGYFTWIKKPLSEAKFTSKFKFYLLTDKRMEGLIGTIENWYFENYNKSFLTRLNEIWKNIDNKNLKVDDRIYFSCTEEWEIDTLRDKIIDKYTSYSSEEVTKAIESCCKSKSAPFERLAFENCVLMRMRAKV